VLGDNLKRPITTWHGAQIEAIFKQHDKLWQAEPLRSGLEQLAKDSEVANVIADLLQVFQSLSSVHERLSMPKADTEALKTAVKTFKLNVGTYVFQGIPATCQYRLKFYDRAILSHVVEMSEDLSRQGISLSAVSRTVLEANNKVLKGILRRLPGGGKAHEDCAHLKRTIVASRVARERLYARVQEIG
jgi:hypothetical protein